MIEKLEGLRVEGEECYCDHCGDIVYHAYNDRTAGRLYVEDKPYEVFEEVPWDVASANAGESAVLCSECVESFRADVPPCPDCGGEGQRLGNRNPEQLTRCGNCKGWFE